MAECRTCIHAYVNGLYVYCRLKKTWIPLDKTKTGCNNYTQNPLLKKPIKFINLHMRFEPVRS